MDEGKPRTIVLDSDEMMVQLPVGWFIEQTGLWYTAVFGEERTIGPTVRLQALVEAVWWDYNRTGAPLLRTPARQRVRSGGVSRETHNDSVMQLSLSGFEGV